MPYLWLQDRDGGSFHWALHCPTYSYLVLQIRADNFQTHHTHTEELLVFSKHSLAHNWQCWIWFKDKKVTEISWIQKHNLARASSLLLLLDSFFLQKLNDWVLYTFISHRQFHPHPQKRVKLLELFLCCLWDMWPTSWVPCLSFSKTNTWHDHIRK